MILRRWLSSAVAKGVVTRYNATRGIGKILTDNGEELFVHQSEIYAPGFRSLRVMEHVEFTIATDDKGRTKAVNVTGPDGKYVQGAPTSPSRKQFF